MIILKKFNFKKRTCVLEIEGHEISFWRKNKATLGYTCKDQIGSLLDYAIKYAQRFLSGEPIDITFFSFPRKPSF